MLRLLVASEHIWAEEYSVFHWLFSSCEATGELFLGQGAAESDKRPTAGAKRERASVRAHTSARVARRRAQSTCVDDISCDLLGAQRAFLRDAPARPRCWRT